jgi:hypothetical protein
MAIRFGDSAKERKKKKEEKKFTTIIENGNKSFNLIVENISCY